VYSNEQSRGEEERVYNLSKFDKLLEQLLSTFSASSQHLLSPFYSPFFRVKLLYDYGFREQSLRTE
jgi:hypothetical protein